jgi:alkylhydroperoxidase family enzyme
VIFFIIQKFGPPPRNGRAEDVLQVWREAEALFDVEERPALAWAETVTRVAETAIPDSEYEAARKVFNGKQPADLTIAIA